MVELTIALLVIGIVFLLLEMWLTGVEFFAIIGLICLAVSAVMAVLFVTNGWLIVAGQVVIIAFFIRYMYNFMKRKQLQGKLILSENLEAPLPEDYSKFLGQVGKTTTLLKPFGEADFSGTLLQVSSNGPMVSEGTKVRIIEAQPSKIVVCEIEEESNAN